MKDKSIPLQIIIIVITITGCSLKSPETTDYLKTRKQNKLSSRFRQKLNQGQLCLIFMVCILGQGYYSLTRKTRRTWNVLGQLETSQCHNQNLCFCGCRKRGRTWQMGKMMFPNQKTRLIQLFHYDILLLSRDHHLTLLLTKYFIIKLGI